jgi:hypothetical protein
MSSLSVFRRIRIGVFGEQSYLLLVDGSESQVGSRDYFPQFSVDSRLLCISFQRFPPLL